MSYSYEREATLDSAPEAVFDFLTDQAKLPLWSPEVVSSEVVGGGRIRPGTRLRQVRRRGKREMVNDVEVVEHDRPGRHSVRTRVLGVDAHFGFLLRADGEGTIVRMTGAVTGRGLGRIVESLLGKMMERADDRALDRLRDAMRASNETLLGP